MRFSVLGPVEVSASSRPAEPAGLAPGASRTLLACLLLHRNTAVSAEELAEALWGGRRPATATESLRNHVMRLRRRVGAEAGGRIRTTPLGYLLEVRPGEVDEDEFLERSHLGREALDAGEWSAAATLFASALALWRGEPLTELAAVPEAVAHAQWLRETRLSAIEGRVAADLRLGRQDRLVPELRLLTARHPLREVFHGQLMLALARTGRQAEAFEAYQHLRTTLAEELGVEPSQPVQRIHRAILSGSTDLGIPAARGARGTGGVRGDGARGAGGAGSGPPGDGVGTGDGVGVGADSTVRRRVPFRLPSDTRHFVGRHEELAGLAGLAAAGGRGQDGAAPVIAVVGSAAVGKSALAVRAAHGMREEFPDGQLFVDLRGHTPGTAALDPAEALEQLLRALGLAPQFVPAELGERAALYRDRLADRRILILLDNAADSAQVRPLLPGTPGSFVLVTSRRNLTGLDDAHTLRLGPLPLADSVALLTRIAGPDRLGSERTRVERLAELCGHVPLALRIAGARLRHHTALDVAELVAELEDEDSRLDGLESDDRSVRAVLEASAAALSEAELRMLRLLAHIPGGRFDAPAAAALDGGNVRTARRLLESLLGHNLLAEASAHRYRFHDLARWYATSLARAADPGEATAAEDRLLDYLLDRSVAGHGALARYRRPGSGSGSAADSTASARGPAPEPTAALAWFQGELDNLLPVAQRAFATRPEAAVDLVAALAPVLQHAGPWSAALALHERAARTARRAGDALREAAALCDLGQLAQLTSDFSRAGEAFDRALSLYRGLGETQGEANVLCDMGRTLQIRGELAAAEELHEQALVHFRRLGDRLGEANARCELGRIHMSTGEIHRAGEDLEIALAVYRDLGSELGAAKCLSELGRHRNQAADAAAARDFVHEALECFQALDFPVGEANCLFELARATDPAQSAVVADLLDRACRAYRRAGSRLGEATATLELSHLIAAQGDDAAAERLLHKAIETYEDLGGSLNGAYALLALGRLRHRAKDPASAFDLCRQALSRFQIAGDRLGVNEALDELALLEAERAAGPTGPPA